MLKKICSTFLSFVMALSCFSVMFSLSASAAALVSSNFESGAVTDYWTVFKSGTTSDYSIVTDANGSKVAYGPAGTSMFKQVTLEAGVQYTLAFDFKFATDNVPASYNSFYRAGFANSVSALSGGNFATTYYNIYSNQGTNRLDWKRHSITFTPSAAMTVYAVIGTYNNQVVASYYVDNVMLYKTNDIVNISTSAGPGGSTSGGGTIVKGETATVTAVPSSGYTFAGWYNGTTQVSSSAVYSFAESEAVTLKALFQSTTNELIYNGNFETTGWTNGWAKLASSLDYLWNVESANFTSGDSTAQNGMRYVKSGAANDTGFTDQSRSFGQKDIVVEPYTDYTLTFIAKSDSPLYRAGVIRNDQAHPSSDVAVSTGSTVALNKGSNWATYTVEFNSMNNSLVAVSFGGQITGITGLYYYVDNVSIVKKAMQNSSFELNLTTSWNTSAGAAIVSTPNTLGIPELGGYMGQFTTTAASESLSTPSFLVTAGKHYEVSFWVRKVNNALTDTTNLTFSVLDQSGTPLLQNPAGGSVVMSQYHPPGNVALAPKSTTKTDSSIDAIATQFGTLRQVVLSFTADSTKTAHLEVALSEAGAIYIDRLELFCSEDIGTQVKNNVNHVGTAIRTTGVQGLRFKTEVNNSVRAPINRIYTVVEYGTIAIKDAYLSGRELVKDGSYLQGDGITVKTAKTGMAYQTASNLDVQFALTANGVQYTCVLTNISDYTATYTIRPYMIIMRPDGVTETVYGQAQSKSIFNVALLAYNAPGSNNGYAESPEVRDTLYTKILHVVDPITYPLV